MLCGTCGAKCTHPVQGSDEGIRVFLYYCAMCNVHKVVFEYDIEKNDLLRAVSTVNYVKEYLKSHPDNWEVGLVDYAERKDE